MKRSRRNTCWPLVVSTALLLATLATAFLTSQTASEAEPWQEVQSAWRKAQQVGLYHFATEIVQTTYPAPAIANVGRSSRQDTLYIEGQINLPERTLLMTLNNNSASALNARDGYEVRVEGDRAYGRSTGGTWQDMSDFSSAFAPGNDLMAYLAGAKNLKRVESREWKVEGGESTLNSLHYTLYEFDVDGPAFAAYVRDQLERYLAEKGELPQAMSLDTPRQLKGVTGTGQVWIDGDGLPLRLSVHLEYPEQSNGERVKADIKTDFSGFPRNALAQAGPSENPVAWLTGTLGLPRPPQDWQRLGAQFGVMLGCAGLLLLLVTPYRSKKVYASFVLVIVFSMVVTPLLESQQASAFFERQAAQRAELEQTQQDQEAIRDAQRRLDGSNWDPHRDPLSLDKGTTTQADQRAAALDVFSSPDRRPATSPDHLGALPANLQAAAGSGGSGSDRQDDDGDGLTNKQEADLGTNPSAKDSDGDGLDDGIEVLHLGTLPNNSDSDNDGIPDKKEIDGFYWYQQWYLDPTNPDTNGDGLADTLECPEFANNSGVTGTTCKDTDNDHIPDAFDLDNDGDGVPDRVDLSPFTKLPARLRSTAPEPPPFSRDNPFSLSINGANANTPIFVDFQLRPQNPNHLVYAMSVLDWPAGDVEGQIQRVLTTTFASSMTPDQVAADPHSGNGDIRLTPMLEIQMSGSTIPLSLTVPQVSAGVGAPFTGVVSLKQQSGDIGLTFAFSNTGASYQVGIYTGTCPVSSGTIYSWSGVGNGASRTINNKYLVDLADGRHFVGVSDGSQTACGNLGNLVNGPYRDKMIDPELLKPYGVTVREKDDNGTLLAYVPLNMVMDETGGSRVAFSARMPYWLTTSTWGDAHPVRLVWLVQMLADSCVNLPPTPSGYTDQAWSQYWCSNPANRQEQTQIVHAYYDDWTLTGLSVREDHGLKVAIAFEDPATDADKNNDEYLWRLGYGLVSTFVAGRAITNTSGVRVRDMTVDKIKTTFDVTSTATISPTRWGIPLTATRIVSLPFFPHQDYLAQIPMVYTKQILRDYFTDGSGQPKADAPTLLFAREEYARSATLDVQSMIQRATTHQVAVNLGDAPLETLAALNWAPYRFKDGAWEPHPLNDYWDRLAGRLQRTFKADSELYNAGDPDRQLTVDGAVAVAQTFYVSLYQGSSGVVQSGWGNGAVIFEQANTQDRDLSQLWRGYGSTAKAITQLVTQEIVMTLRYVIAINQAANVVGGSYITVLQGFGRLLKGEYAETTMNGLAGLARKITGLSRAAKVGLGVAVAVVAVGFLVTWAVLEGTGIHIATYVIESAKLAIGVLSFVMTLKGIYSIAGISVAHYTAEGMARLASKINLSFKAGAIALIIGLVVTFGFFLYSVYQSGVSLASLAFRGMLAYFVANVIVAVMLFVLSQIPVVGQILAAIIALLDSLIAFICNVTPEDKLKNTAGGQWFCKGVSGLMAEVVKCLIYGVNAIVDLKDTQRIQMFNFDQGFATPEDMAKGMTPDTQLSFSLGITSNLRLAKVFPDWETMVDGWKSGTNLIPVDWKSVAYGYQFSNDNLKKSNMAYKLQTTQTDFHEGMETEAMLPPTWAPSKPDIGKFAREYFYITRTVQANVSPLTTYGINQAVVVYLSEAYAVPAQECWAIPIPPLWGVPPIPFVSLAPVCKISTDRASSHTNLGLRYDVFPPTLDQFLQLTPKDGGYSLAWGQNYAITSTALSGAPLTFMRQRDADGDGLVNRIDGGPDPDDSRWDTDYDGLSDDWELAHGTDPSSPDTDADGVSDYDEIRLNTDPRRKDTDGDGLTDRQEVNGWEYVYRLDPDGTRHSFWVTPDPLNPDTDGDGLTDFQEWVFGFNPRVQSDPNVLTFASQVRERGAARLLLHLNEERGATTFNDDSGFSNHATCTGVTCPAAGQQSQEGYGLALQFDGTDDWIQSTDFSIGDNFALSLWVNPDKTNDNQAFIGKHDASGNDILVFGFYSGGYQVKIRGASYQAGTKTTGWQHLAVVGTKSGSTTAVTVYKNGYPLWQQALNATVGGTSGKLWVIGQDWDSSTKSDYFDGLMDEVMVFNRALSDGEVKVLAHPRGPFPSNDLFVKRSDVLDYQATVRNDLLDRYAQGLWSASFPVTLTGPLAPTAFVLHPTEQITLSSSVTVSPTATSGGLDLTQVAGAYIADWRGQSNNAEMWLRLDDPVTATTFLDYSGALPPRDATCSGGSCPDRQQTGMFNYALKFSSGRYLDLKNPTTLGLKGGDWTLSVWVKGSNYDVYKRTILATNNLAAPSLYIFDGKPMMEWGGGITPDYSQEVGSGRLSTGVWYHLVFRYQGGRRSVFVNGQLWYSGSGGYLFQSALQAPLYLGRAQFGDYFDGYMDDVRIFSRALSDQEIRELLYAAPALKMDMEPTGNATYFNDLSSFGNSGTGKTNGGASNPTRDQGGVSGQSASFNGTNYIEVNPSSSLDLSGGKFTLAAWVYPKSSGDSTKDGYTQGILGKNSGTSSAYPSLEVIDRKVRFGFGASGVSWSQTSCTTDDVLTRNDWNHIVATYDTITVAQQVKGQLAIYVNGVQKKACGLADWYKPASGAQGLMIGRTNNQGTVYVDQIKHVSIHDEIGPKSEVYLEWNDAHICEGTNEIIVGKGCRYGGLNKGDVRDVHASRTVENTGHLEAWEDDNAESSKDDLLGTSTFSTNDVGFPSQTLSWNGLEVTLGDAGTAAFANESIPFTGNVDEVRVYRQALDAAMVDELYQAKITSLHLHFDDPPGSTRFENTVGPMSTYGGCAGSACPTAGVAGRLDQAFLFGGDDYVEAEVDVSESAYAASLWFQTSCSNCGLFSVDKGTRGDQGHDRHIYLSGGNLCARVYNNETICTTGQNYANGRWHHVVHTFGGGVGGQKLYVDGTQRASGAKSSSNFTGQTGVNVGFSNDAGSPYFQGRIDEVRIFKQALTAAQVQTVWKSAPQLQLHLDDAHGATQFTDDSGNGNTGTCTGSTCPNAGTKGQVGLAAEFDGVDDAISIVNNSTLQGNSFTVGAWVMPTAIKDDYQPLIVKENGTGGQRNYGLFIAPNSMRVHYSLQKNDCATWVASTTVGSLVMNQWNHVMMTYDGSQFKLYLNGNLDSTQNAAGSVCQVAVPLKIGSEVSAFKPFAGRMDEVVMYDHALSEFEVRDIFLYQGRWVEERQTQRITVDEEPPVSFLRSYTPTLPYQSNRDVQMLVEAHDPSSGVGAVELGVKKNASDSFAWSLAPRCRDAVGDSAWCPTFDPGPLGGAGQYILQTRATDLVGRTESPAQTFTLYVDGAAPNLTLSSSGLITGFQHPTLQNAWAVRVSGTVQDPQIASGIAGSGVPTDSVRVTLLATNGSPAGEGTQLATVTSGGDVTCRSSACAWRVDYAFLEADPSGVYTVSVQAADKVGNQRTLNLGTVQVDAAAPATNLDVTSVTTTTLNSAAILRGDVAERSVPITVTWTTDDGGGYQAGVAIRCNNVTLYSAEPRTFYTQTASYIWNGHASKGAACQVDLKDSAGNGGVTGLAQVCGTQVTSWDGSYGSTRSVPFTASAATCPADTTIAGVNKAEVGFKPILPGSPFYNETPPANQVLYLPFEDNPDKDGNLYVRDMAGNGANNYSGLGHDGRCSGQQCPSVGQAGHIGNGFWFDGKDDYVDLGRSSINQLTRTLSVMAWIKLDQVIPGAATVQWIMGTFSSFPVSGNLDGFGFGVARSGLRFSTLGVKNYDTTLVNLSPGVWYHVAAVMNPDYSVTFYVDGQARQTVAGSAPANPDNNSPLMLSIPRKVYPDLPFSGSMDEVRLFDRTLSAAQVKSIYLGSGPSLALPFDESYAASSIVLADESGWAHDGTLQAGVGDLLNKAVPGQVGAHALAFDGVDDFVQVAPHAGLDLSGGRFTQMVWVYPTPQDNGVYPILGSAAYTDTGYHYPFVQVVNRTQLNVGFGDGSSLNSYTTGNILTENAWNHVATTFDGATLRVYVNGVERGSTTWVGKLPAPTRQLDVGRGRIPSASVCARLTQLRIIPNAWSLYGYRVKFNGAVAWSGVVSPNSVNTVGPNLDFCDSGQLAVDRNYLGQWISMGVHTVNAMPGSDGHTFTGGGKSVTVEWDVAHTDGLRYWRGQIDDVRIYPRALSELEIKSLYATAWQAATLTPTGGAGVTVANWNAPAPAGLEGTYRLDVRGSDVAGHFENSNQGAWSGNVDTLAPRVTLTRTTVGSNDHYVATAQDFNLTDQGLMSPCGPGVVTTREYFQSPWYTTLAGQRSASNQRLYGLTAVCDVDPLQIAVVGAYDTPGSARNVVISGTYAYIADGQAGLQIVDISDPTRPTKVGSYDTPGTAYDVVVSGAYAYVADYDGGLQIINVSNPAVPTRTGFYVTDSPAFGVAVAGGYAYVAEWNMGLEVVDISDPGNPMPMGSDSTVRPVTAVVVSGTMAYLTTYDNGLQIDDVTLPQVPIWQGQYNTPGFAERLALSGTYAYVADGQSGLRIVNVLTPTSPTEIGFYDTPGYARGVTVSGNYACVADHYGGLQVVNVSNPSNPQLLRTYDTPGEAWGVAISGTYAYIADGSRGLRIVDLFAPVPANQMKACDMAGNCATATAGGIQALATPLAFAQGGSITMGVSILNVPPVLASLDSVSIAGDARAITSSLQALTVTAESAVIHTQTWASGVATQTNWSASWTPSGEGLHWLDVALVAWDGNTAGDSITVTVDILTPTIIITSTVFTSTHYHLPGSLDLSGLATDTMGVENVEWRLEGGDWQAASIVSDTWSAAWYLGAGVLPDGMSYTVTAKARDVGGHTTQATQMVFVDVAPPTPVTLTLNSGGSALVPYSTLSEVSSTLTLTWTASSDGSGLANYQVGWTTQETSAVSTTLRVFDPITQTDVYTASDGQKVKVQLASQDVYDNKQTAQTVGPVYVDSPLTPDYVVLNDLDGVYLGWMDNGCTRIGVDRRIIQNAPGGSFLNAEQKLYASWNVEALRLAWTGANWGSDGDLFIYLDTKPGGVITTVNPYAAAVTGTVIYLPGVTPTSTVNAMTADYMVWVRDSGTAILLEWDGSDWAFEQNLSGVNDRYRFDPVLNGGQTDLYLPWESIGITDTASATLDLVAFASEEDALRLWAVMPSANPVNSARVIAGAIDAGQEQTFALSTRYHWPSLGAGLCPNGSQTPSAPQYTDADLRLSVSAEPPAKSYSFAGGDLFQLWDVLLGDRPGDVSALFASADSGQPPLGNDQVVNYTIHYRNLGSETATGVVADVSSHYAMLLPGGTHIPSEMRDHQVINLPDIGPGAEGSVTFTGRVDVATGQTYYTTCRLSQPEEICSAYRRLASADVRFYDSAHGASGSPLERVWMDHHVDYSPPQFLGVQQPEYVIPAGNNPMRGYAYDETGVPTVTLQVQPPIGGPSALTCLDDVPQDGQWLCDMNTTGSNDGDVFQVSLQATDSSGLPSAWSVPYAFVVDTLPPTVTLDLTATQMMQGGVLNASRNAFTLFGQVADNRGLGSVEVCDEGSACALATVQLADAGVTRVYDDEPPTPIAINGATTCGGAEIVRTFNVTESFVIGRVSVGFDAEHAHRDDLQVTLASPGGPTVILLASDGISGTDFANYDVFLNDAALGVYSAKTDDDPAEPYYDRLARPYSPLQASIGQNALGTWTLSICDTDPSANDGAYHRSRLELRPRDTAARTGNWSYTLPDLGALDYVEKQVSIYGIDLVGNRATQPVTLSFTVDNVLPALTVTQLVTSTLFTPTVVVLAGSLGDGSFATGQMGGVQVTVLTPEGAVYTERAPQDGSEWRYDLQAIALGRYTLWVSAADLSGNISSAGPFEVDVHGLTQIYLPLIMNRFASGPDLVVERIIATSNNVQVVIRNQGDRPVTDEFWVDLYVDPNPPPTGVNQTWNDGRSTQGIAWGVTTPALPSLQPGGVLTLTVGDTYYWPSLSRMAWPLPVGTPIYAQVDSANAGTTYGAVLENHESAGDEYNNIASTDSTSTASATLQSNGRQAAPPPNGKLPPRP